MSPAASRIFAPVAAASTYEETVARLGTAIRIGLLEPGERLPPERELAVALDISRSTLRQALAKLTESGHLVALRGRTGGTFVADDPPIASGDPVELEESRALLDWRLTVELGTVELAAERATPAQRDALREAADATTATWADFRREDARFHILLAEAARSPRVVDEMTRVQGALSDLLHHIGRDHRDVQASRIEHRKVAEAIHDGDATVAREALRGHLAATERVLDGALSG